MNRHAVYNAMQMAEEKITTGEETKPDAVPEEGKETAAQQEPSQQEKDHEAELKRLREQIVIANKAAADAAFKLREKKRKEEADGGAGDGADDDDAEKPVTASELQAILQRDRDGLKKELHSSLIAEKVRKLARTETEAQLIIEVHKSRVFPEWMPLDEQLEEAHLLANKKSILAQNEELRRSLRGKETVSDDGAGTHRDSPALDEPKTTDSDKRALQSAGFQWDGKTRLYVKPIGKHKILIYDPKTKAQKLLEK